jgi:ribosomal protein S18 acetylase RimI-like enzyme
MTEPEPFLETLRSALRLACQGQHMEGIMKGRQKVLTLHREWVLLHLEPVAAESLDLSDEWEYRRPLELAALLDAGLVQRLVWRGLASSDPDVREAAEDFRAGPPIAPGLSWSLLPVTAHDLPFLRQMLWEAAYWREASLRAPLASDLDRPDLVYLLDHWGRAGDAGVLAEAEGGTPFGAAWYRLWTHEQHSYGFVSPDIPELAVGVVEEVRGQGIGFALVHELLNLAEQSGLPGVSLSVEPDNPARRLYTRIGFRDVETVGRAWTMLYLCQP